MRLRLHHRIVVPFALAALIATSAVAYVGLWVGSRALQAGAEARLVNAADLVSQSDFSLNPAILRSVRAIAGADVLTFSGDGGILATTATPERSRALLAALTSGAPASRVLALAGNRAVVVRADCSGPCLIAYRELTSRPGTGVAVAATLTEVTSATRAVQRTILIAAVLSLALLLVVSQSVAARLTAPLDELVQFAQGVAAGRDVRRPPFGDDEIGRLGRAFNNMLEGLERAREALVRSEKLSLAGLMAARVAHDIRNPLSSIKMHTQLLQVTPQTSAAPQVSLAAILHDIDQIEVVIRGLLELARPGAPALQLASINDVLSAALQHMAPQCAHRKITVQLHLQSGLPPVALDSQRFTQAFLNVAVNAAEAMPTGGIMAVATRLAADRAAVLVEVCDEGGGVDPAIAGRLFDPFVSTKRDGVGLGLVNTKAIVENHGGHVTVAPREPRGTCVTLILPVATKLSPPAERGSAHG